MPYEILPFLYTDDRMDGVYKKIKKSIDYAEVSVFCGIY